MMLLCDKRKKIMKIKKINKQKRKRSRRRDEMRWFVMLLCEYIMDTYGHKTQIFHSKKSNPIQSSRSSAIIEMFPTTARKGHF